MQEPFLIIGFIVALSLAVGLWNRFFGLLAIHVIADDPNPTSSYPKAPSGPREVVPLTDCPACGTYAYHLFTPRASVQKCGYDVKMIGRECVTPFCAGVWTEEVGLVAWPREDLLSAIEDAEWDLKTLYDIDASGDMITEAYLARNQLQAALELTR